MFLDKMIYFLILYCFIIQTSSGTSASDMVCYVTSTTSRSKLYEDAVFCQEGTKCTISCHPPVLNKKDMNDLTLCTVDYAATDGTPKAYYVRNRVIVFLTKSLKRQDTGNYTVRCPGSSRTISVHILYPPNNVDIHGPYAIEKGSPLNLSCEADSNAPARYWWKYDISDDSPVIATGAVINLPAWQHDYSIIFCLAQNTMVPTLGPVVRKAPVHKARHLLFKQELAYIRDLPEEFSAYSGFSISIFCDVGGFPGPSVWWTKQDDASFMKTGNRLTADNVKGEFAGDYECHAENVVTKNGTDHKVHSSKTVHVKVIAQPGSQPDWLLVAAVTYSVIALVGLTIGFLYCIRKRRILANRRAVNDSTIPPVRLSTIMSSDEAVSDLYGHSSNQPTENSCDPSAQALDVHEVIDLDETRKKSIDDTPRLSNLL